MDIKLTPPYKCNILEGLIYYLDKKMEHNNGNEMDAIYKEKNKILQTLKA